MWVANLPFISYPDSPADDLAPEKSAVPDEGDDKLCATEFTAGDLDAKSKKQKHKSCMFRIKSKKNHENSRPSSLTSETVRVCKCSQIRQKSTWTQCLCPHAQKPSIKPKTEGNTSWAILNTGLVLYCLSPEGKTVENGDITPYH